MEHKKNEASASAATKAPRHARMRAAANIGGMLSGSANADKGLPRTGPKSTKPSSTQDVEDPFKEPSRESVIALNEPFVLSPNATDIGSASRLDSLLQLLGQTQQGNQLCLPFFQRPYAWEKRHVEKLFDDLKEGFGSTPDSARLLGPIVLGCLSTKAKDLLILDGQQRITTFTLFIAAFRHQFRLLGGNPNLSDGVRSVLSDSLSECNRLLFTDLIKKQPVLRVNETLSEFFKKYIHNFETVVLYEELEHLQDFSSVMEERACKNLYSLNSKLEEFMGEVNMNKRATKLYYFYKFVTTKTMFNVNIMSNVPSERLMRSYFVSINESGLPLCAEDSLMVHILGRTNGDKAGEWHKTNGNLSLFNDAFIVYRNGLRSESLDGFQALFRIYSALHSEDAFSNRSASNREAWTDVITRIAKDPNVREPTQDPKALSFIVAFLRIGAAYHQILRCDAQDREVRCLLRLLVLVPPRLDDWQKLLLGLLSKLGKTESQTEIICLVARLVAAHVLLGKDVRNYRKALEGVLRLARPKDLHDAVTALKEKCADFATLASSKLQDMVAKDRLRPDENYGFFLVRLYDFITCPVATEQLLPENFMYGRAQRSHVSDTLFRLANGTRKDKKSNGTETLGNLMLLPKTEADRLNKMKSSDRLSAVLDCSHKASGVIQELREFSGDADIWTKEMTSARGKHMINVIVKWIGDPESRVTWPTVRQLSSSSSFSSSSAGRASSTVQSKVPGTSQEPARKRHRQDSSGT